MTSKGGIDFKKYLSERERHDLTHYRKGDIKPETFGYDYFSTSKDGLWENYRCRTCGATITMPVGAHLSEE
jgi:hypothetical protein